MCGLTRNTKHQMEKHMKEHNEEIDDGDFTCDECSYQNNSRDQLAKHIKEAYKRNNSSDITVAVVICRRCGNESKDKNELIKHILDTHPTYKPCIKFRSNTCKALACRFNHIKLQENEEICYKCGKQFTSKTDIINHIKEKHSNEVCHKFISNQCDRSSEECIFSHITTPNMFHNTENLSRPQNEDFQQAPPLHSPALGRPNMSEHIQMKQQANSSQAIQAFQKNIIQMIPQIIAQVVAALAVNINQQNMMEPR